MNDLLKHIKMIHDRAVGIDGKIVLASYGEGLSSKIRHFQIGDYVSMAECAAQWSEESGRNVYAPLVVMRPSLPEGLKGGEVDIVAVLGIVADFDDDDAKNWKERLPFEPDYVYETSAGRFQAAYLFKKPLCVAEVKNLGIRLKSFSCCDHGTADMSHIWRLPDTKNYPSQKKLNEGRSPEPQTVKVVKSWAGSLACPDTLSSRLPEIPDPVIALESHDLISEINADDLPEDLRNKIINGVEQGQRSDIFYHVVCVLKNMCFSVDAIYSLLVTYPNGIAQKYALRNDLRKQVEKCFTKATNGFLDDFSSLPLDEIERIAKQNNPLKPIFLSSSSFISLGEATWRDSGVPLFKHFMNRETLVVVYGPSNSGKSFLVLDYALHLAAGLDWAGYKCKEKMAVLYICAESGSSFGKRVVAARNKLGLSENVPLHEIPFAYYTARLDLLSNKEHLKKIEQLIDELEKKSGFKCGLVVIDTLSAAFGGGNENGEDMTKFVNNMSDIKFNKKVTPLIIHHEGKTKSADARGHSSLKCNIDTEIRVTPDQNNKGVFTSTKQKDDAIGGSKQFGLRVIELGYDEDRELITTCSVFFETDDFVDSYFDDLKGNNELAFLTIHKFQEPDFLQFCQHKNTRDVRELMIKYWLIIKRNSQRGLSLQQLLKDPLKFEYGNKSSQFQKCFDKIKPRFGNPEISLDQWIGENLVNISQALPNQKGQAAN